MQEKTLSVFIDESGDFGPYDYRAPFYIVAIVLHNQQIDIMKEICSLENHLDNLGYKQHAIHTGPLIRRESFYVNDSVKIRKRLFSALFNFVRKVECNYVCAKVRKDGCADVTELSIKLSKEISNVIKAHAEFLHQFDRIIVYYDNGQNQLTKILTSVFGELYGNTEFRKVKPADYKLFQAADMICTIELLEEKAKAKSFSRSEIEFFGSIREFKKNYLKPLIKKRL